MNEIGFQLFVYGFILSLKKLAYLKYERVLLYSNDRLVGFSTPSLSFKKVNKGYTPYGKIFYQILWGCKNVKATQSCSSRPIEKKKRRREKKT